jgi:hypothetical protein
MFVAFAVWFVAELFFALFVACVCRYALQLISSVDVDYYYIVRETLCVYWLTRSWRVRRWCRYALLVMSDGLFVACVSRYALQRGPFPPHPPLHRSFDHFDIRPQA